MTRVTGSTFDYSRDKFGSYLYRQVSRHGGQRALDAWFKLLLFAFEHRPDGDLSGFSDEQLARALQTKADMRRLFEFLGSIGMAKGTDGARQLRGWSRKRSTGAQHHD